MNGVALLNAFSAEVLSFDFARGGNAPALQAPPDPPALERMAERCAAAFARSGRERLALLGLGSGALAARLSQALPQGVLAVCEADPALVRAALAAGRVDYGVDRRAGLAADTSPLALFMLLDRAGFTPRNALALPNPELPPGGKARLRPLELLFSRTRPVLPPAGAPCPDLTAAAILAPGEPGLPGFFAQFPAWLRELVVVWDADAPPEVDVRASVPVRQLARPLGGDFAAQRNAMLDACGGEFVVYLDADERLPEQAWAALPALCAAPGVSGWHFPRVTPYPTPERALAGFGLWPDIQLRLFRRGPGLRFVNPVHERLVGLADVPGGQALALDLCIEHLARLRKTDAELRRKLTGFDAAGEGAGVRHALSREYPSVPRAWLERVPGDARADGGPGRGLLLPAEAM